jgi:hypothetical protein
LQVQGYLLNKGNCCPRITKKATIEECFGAGADVIEEEEVLTPDEDQDEETPARKKKHARAISVKKHWLREGLVSLCKDGQMPTNLVNTLVDHMMGILISPLTIGPLQKSHGGELILRTIWQWRSADKKSARKQFRPVAESTLQEHIAISQYCRMMLRTQKFAVALCNGMANVINKAMVLKDTIDKKTKQMKQVQTKWTWPDALPLRSFNEDEAGEADDDISLLVKELDFHRTIRQHQKTIAKLVQTVENSDVTLLHLPSGDSKASKGGPICMEVRHAVDHLLKVRHHSFQYGCQVQNN